jgi:hypothetical protein
MLNRKIQLIVGDDEEEAHILDPLSLLGRGVLPARAIWVQASCCQGTIQLGKVWVISKNRIVDWWEHGEPQLKQ